MENFKLGDVVKFVGVEGADNDDLISGVVYANQVTGFLHSFNPISCDLKLGAIGRIIDLSLEEGVCCVEFETNFAAKGFGTKKAEDDKLDIDFTTEGTTLMVQLEYLEKVEDNKEDKEEDEEEQIASYTISKKGDEFIIEISNSETILTVGLPYNADHRKEIDSMVANIIKDWAREFKEDKRESTEEELEKEVSKLFKELFN